MSFCLLFYLAFEIPVLLFHRDKPRWIRRTTVTHLRSTYYFLFYFQSQDWGISTQAKSRSLLIPENANIQHSHTHWEYTALSTGITVQAVHEGALRLRHVAQMEKKQPKTLKPFCTPPPASKQHQRSTGYPMASWNEQNFLLIKCYCEWEDDFPFILTYLNLLEPLTA